MSKLWKILRKQKESKNNKRFYTLRDMAEIKHDEAKKNSRIKRGEEITRGNNNIVLCGCGIEGCFIHNGWNNPKQYQGWNNTNPENYHNSGNPDKLLNNQ